MTYYFEVYLRPAGPLIDVPLIWDGEELYGWHRLQLLPRGAKFTLSGQPHALGDGTDMNDGEQAELQAATLWASKNEWEYLRTTFHNKKCDILLYDHNCATAVAIIYGMQTNVSWLLTSGESELIQLAGARNMNNAGAALMTVLADNNVTDSVEYSAGDNAYIAPGLVMSWR